MGTSNTSSTLRAAKPLRPAKVRPLAARYGDLREKIRRLEKEKEEVAAKLKAALADAGVTEMDAKDFRIALVERRGSVDYKGLLLSFHEPAEAELEAFRGAPSVSLDVKFAPPPATSAKAIRSPRARSAA